MPLKFDVGELFKDMDNLIQVAGATAANTTREKEKALLTAVVEKLKQARNDLVEQLPKAADKLKAHAEANLARAEQTQAEFQNLQKKLEEMMAAVKAGTLRPPPAPAAAPAAPTPDIDPALGAKLRDDLLGMFAPPGTGSAPAAPGKDIWEDWK